VALLALCAGSYGLFIEPYWLETTHHTVVFPGRRKTIKIAHLTDLHFSKWGRLENAVLRKIEEEKPDLIVITGDTVDNGGHQVEAAKFLASLKAPMGVFAVNGNWEHWSLNPEQARQLARAR
jgi:predicted MPP superfamily phosphohydrolase